MSMEKTLKTFNENVMYGKMLKLKDRKVMFEIQERGAGRKAWEEREGKE